MTNMPLSILLLAATAVAGAAAAASPPPGVAPAMSRARIEAGLKAHDQALYIKQGWIRDPYITLGPDDESRMKTFGPVFGALGVDQPTIAALFTPPKAG